MEELGRAITDESSKLPMKVQFLSATEAIELIPDEATVGLIGGGGGLVEATLLSIIMWKKGFWLQAIRKS